MVANIWTKEKRTPISREDLATVIGYTSLNGAARIQLAALNQFGLLESTEERTRLSETAVELMVQPADSAEYQVALRRTALRPELFREIQSTRRHASDDSLRAYLINKMEFSAEQAKTLIKAFRETMRFAKPDSDGYGEPNFTIRRFPVWRFPEGRGVRLRGGPPESARWLPLGSLGIALSSGPDHWRLGSRDSMRCTNRRLPQ